MPVTPTYPGVYIEEIPSGVHTITGVSTAVTAFVGSAKRGPVNKAVHILSFADFERRYGGLSADSEMSYALRQFFLNGGADAWVVRLAKTGTTPAFTTIVDASARDALKITALDDGKSGNDIEIVIDYKTFNPASTFNLTVNYVSSDNPSDRATESYLNLSMRTKDGYFVEDVVTTSTLIKAERVSAAASINGLGAGTSVSGELVDNSSSPLDVATLLDATHNRIQIVVNDLDPVAVDFALPGDVSGATIADRLQSLCKAIRNKVIAAANGEQALESFACVASENKITMTSGKGGEDSLVHVLPGATNDASARLKLGTANGGIETDAVAAIRPVEVPDHGTLLSGNFGGTDLDSLPDATHHNFLISLDGSAPDTVALPSTKAAGRSLADKLADVAGRIQTVVRAIKPTSIPYNAFTCTVSGGTKLLLCSGSRGADSSVNVAAADSNSIANELHLLVGATINPAKDRNLTGGTESPYSVGDAFNLFIADRSKRKGIFALEAVDIFNILCLPGISDGGLLQEAVAYCKERRAFLIADAPAERTNPSDMVTFITGPNLPKSDYGAVYYPWTKVADPLKGGALRVTAPCGTIAGLYARTDGARGVWKAPAGADATLAGVQAATYLLTDMENGTLNPLGVNCIRVLPVFGAVAWGARTLRGADQMTSEYKYVPIRRLALYLEESLYRGTKWVVFEPNDEPLWAQIRLNIGAFMHSLFLQGAFHGKASREAYFVKCDKETTTQNDINKGIVNIVVGFAPLKPAEFVIIKIQQMAGQIET